MFPKLYKVKSPDGTMMNVEGPEGASEADVIAKAQELSNNYWNMEAYYKGSKAVYNVNLNAPTVPVMRDGKQVDTLYKVSDKGASFNPKGLFINQSDKTKGIEFNLNNLKNNDSASQYIQNNVFQSKLGDILNHTKLYKDYPFLKDIPIKLVNQNPIEDYAYAIVNSDNDGPYISMTANAFLNKKDYESVMESVLHEAQHIIDYYENPYTASMDRNAEEIAYQVETDYILDDLLPSVYKWEGGYQNNPKDTGNYTKSGKLIGTNKGISAKTLEEYLGKEPTEEDMKTLTDSDVYFIYKEKYFDTYKIDEFNYEIRPIMYHAIINSPVANIKELQRKAGVTSDGIIGPKTIKAINKLSANEIKDILLARYERDMTPEKWKEFGKGLINRFTEVSSQP